MSLARFVAVAVAMLWVCACRDAGSGDAPSPAELSQPDAASCEAAHEPRPGVEGEAPWVVYDRFGDRKLLEEIRIPEHSVVAGMFRLHFRDDDLGTGVGRVGKSSRIAVRGSVAQQTEVVVPRAS